LIESIDNILGRLDENASGYSTSLAIRDIVRLGPIEIIDSLLSDEGALRRSASMSYLHNNGFYKIVISCRNNCGYKLRVHLWENCGKGKIHDHSWDYHSLLLYGSYRMLTHTPIKQKQGTWHRIEVPNIMASCDESRIERSVYSLETSTAIEVFPGRIVGLPYHVVHSVDITKSPNATIMVHTGHKREYSNVFTEDQGVKVMRMNMKNLSGNQLSEILNNVKSRYLEMKIAF